MIPAQQRFDASHFTGGEADARLIVQYQLLAAHRQSQKVFDRQPLLCLGIHRLRKKLIVVAPLGFGVIHGDVGVLHHRLRIVAVLGVDGDADRTRGVELMLADLDRSGQRGNHFLGDALRLLPVAWQVFKDDGEFITAESRHRVADTHTGQQSRRNALQQFITDIVAERIIDGLKAVEVDEHEAQPRFLARRVGQPECQTVIEQHAIGQAGQGVTRGQKFDLLFGRLALADVGGGAGHATDATARVVLGDFSRRMQPHPAAVPAGDAVFAGEFLAGTMQHVGHRRLEFRLILGVT